MELKQLRYFVAVAEEKHFGRAAQKLHRSQPPVSTQVRSLERELGVDLLLRTTRSVELTPAGEVFLERVKRVLEVAEEARLSVGLAAQGFVGHLTIGFVSSAALSLLPLALRTFRAAYPQITLNLRELTSAEQRTALLEGAIDVGLVRLPMNTADLSVTDVLEEPLLVALPAEHPLAEAETVTLANLADAPLISFPQHLVPGAHAQLMDLFAERGYTPNIVQEAIHLQTIVSLVASGLGVAVLPASARRSPLAGVVYRRLERDYMTSLGLVSQQNSPYPVIANFTRTVLSVAGEAAQLVRAEGEG